MKKKRVIVTGAAGLVGQNLVVKLKNRSDLRVIGIDKHSANSAIFRLLHPSVELIETDLTKISNWSDVFKDADVVVLNHAQIGGLAEAEFIANNITASQNVIEACEEYKIPYLIHISSSVVNSIADDFYTQTKEHQEKIVLKSKIPTTVLRPTLMYGWFDRKHLGWLARFMKRAPIFPIPNQGKYIRQPLYAGDFCDVIISCIDNPKPNEIHNISGHEKIYYIDMIRALKAASRGKSHIVKIPYKLFWVLLKLYAVFDKNPPFTTQQLEALVLPEEFEITEWPHIFDTKVTSIAKAFEQTYNHPEYSSVVLEF